MARDDRTMPLMGHLEELRARLIKALDKLEMALQAKEYERTGVDRRQLADFYLSATRQVTDQKLRRVLRNAVMHD